MSVTGALASSGKETTFVKGAIDGILPRCRAYHAGDAHTPTLETGMRATIQARADAAAARGLRVLALAYGPSSSELVFVGLQAMRDPPRRGAADSVAALGAAGVHVVMITGDAPATALAIARDLGLRGAGAPGGCLTGADVDRMSEGQLREAVARASVFARTTPRHKMDIVRAWQSRGAVVAMTGDGGKCLLASSTQNGCLLVAIVNDAPALKMADIGVAMGRAGTDVAKEAADVILVDDNFATILPAVEEGELHPFRHLLWLTGAHRQEHLS
jgi:Ca2+-transporting ATPase